jgi:hypothetical protein
LAALLTLSIFLNLMSLIVGVAAIITGKSYLPAVVERLRRRRTPASPEDQRLQGISLTLSAVAGLLLSMTIAFVAASILSNIRLNVPFPFALAVLLLVVLMLFVAVLLYVASAIIASRVRCIDPGTTVEAQDGARST